MGNMFKCVLASGTGTGIPLIVTCASAFAGLTITCTDGTTTLTDTCPSSSPYKITFELPNVGSWEVSGTISGETFRESILIQDFDIELNNYVDITVDVYSAANDTVSYVGVDSQTHTITTDSTGHASATITVNPHGSTLTFISSVANEPSDLSSYYSKAITLDSSTTSVYVMPDGMVAYWYGWENSDFEQVTTANGWSANGSLPGTLTRNTNSMTIKGATSTLCGFGKKTTTAQTGTAHIIGSRTRNSSNSEKVGWGNTTGNNKYLSYSSNIVFCEVDNTSIIHVSAQNTSSNNIALVAMAPNTLTLYGAWIETT